MITLLQNIEQLTIGNLVLLALALVLDVGVSCHILLYKREGRSAIAWLGFLWLLPFAGSILYFLFGINRIERKATRLKRSRPELDANQIPDPSPNGEPETKEQTATQAAEKLTQLALLPGNSVKPLFAGDEAYPAMLEAIGSAKKSVGLYTYIFKLDAIGEKFIDALSGAVKRGVQVRVLVDGVGSGYLRSAANRLKSAGIPTSVFLPTTVPRSAMAANLRNHRKILTIDGKQAFTGGLNINANNVLKNNPPFPIFDIGFDIQGPVVAQLQTVFVQDWYFSTQETLKSKAWFPDKIEKVGQVKARAVSGGPDTEIPVLRWFVLAAVASAKHRIRIVSPYFLPDSGVLSALNTAAVRGIEVEVVTPKKSDHRVMVWALKGIAWQVLEKGIKVYRSPGPFDHSKLCTIDGKWFMMGSMNWDARSLRLNFETNVECHDDELTASMDKHIDGLISKSEPFTEDDLKQLSFPERVRNGFARLFLPLL